jgi:hypothetical protein
MAACAGSLIWGAPASAAPITINFEGEWIFNDFEWKFLGCEALPQQCAFVQGLAAVGVTDGSLVSFSLTLNPHIPDRDPSAAVGAYKNAAKATLTLGSNTYRMGPTYANVFADQPCGGGTCPGALSVTSRHFSGPTLHGFGLDLVPFGLQFDVFGPGFTSDSLSAALSNPAMWATNQLLVSFSPPTTSELHIGRVHNMRVTSVPGPGSLSLMSSALIALAFGLRRRRKHAAAAVR